MNLEGSRILVTGGAGLIGSHVIDQLIAEHPQEVIIFDKNLTRVEDHRLPELDYQNVKLFKGDITLVDDVKEALKGIDFVVHTASPLTREAAGNLRFAVETMIFGTFNLLEQSVASGVSKFIFSSSVSIYGEHPLTNPMTEMHPFNTGSMYGAGKVSGELLLRVFKRAKGLEYVVLRYSQVYGPRQHNRGDINRFIPECFDRIERGLAPIIYGDGSQPYDFLYVEDVARANVMALKSPVTGESFNIGTGIATTVRDIAWMILEITGTSLEPVYAPQGNRFRLESLFLDVTKAEKVLGFKSKIPLREGLRLYFDWRKKEMENYNG